MLGVDKMGSNGHSKREVLFYLGSFLSKIFTASKLPDRSFFFLIEVCFQYVLLVRVEKRKYLS